MWLYSTAVCLPPFFGWGGYATEGTLITCSYDYLTQVAGLLNILFYSNIHYFYKEIVEVDTILINKHILLMFVNEFLCFSVLEYVISTNNFCRDCPMSNKKLAIK